MAWRSSGSNNDEMVGNLKRYGVIESDRVENAFRAVDRRFFVPQNQLSLAHSDQPLREGNIHISAPHIYGSIVEALDIPEASNQTFLNVGSGTGYLSSIVAKLVGPAGACYGVELQKDALEHCLASLDRWKASHEDELPLMEFHEGNGYDIDADSGESLIGYDRIYVGASIDKDKLGRLAALLRQGGILVAPVEDELVKVVRIGMTGGRQASSNIPRSIRGHAPLLSLDFTQSVVSTVRFHPLQTKPSSPTVIRSRVWEPSLHNCYPKSFQKACTQLFLCSNAPTSQPFPVPRVPPMNMASTIPKALWLNILSYTRRDWFEEPVSDSEFLRQRLSQEAEATARAEEAKLAAEEQLKKVERERDGFRVLAMRWQSRLQAMMLERAEETETGDRAFFLNEISDMVRLMSEANTVGNLQSDDDESEGEFMDADLDLGGSDEDEDDNEDNDDDEFSDDDDDDIIMDEEEESSEDGAAVEATTTGSNDGAMAELLAANALLPAPRTARTVSITAYDL